MKKFIFLSLLLFACTESDQNNDALIRADEESGRIQACICVPCAGTAFDVDGPTSVVTQYVEYITTVNTVPTNVINLYGNATYRIYNSGSAIYTVKITGGGPELNATVPGGGNYYQYTRAAASGQCGAPGSFPQHQVRWKRLTCGYPGGNNMNLDVSLHAVPLPHSVNPLLVLPNPGLHVGISSCPPGY